LDFDQKGLKMESEFKALCAVAERYDKPLIKAQRIAYAIFQRPDLHAAEQFFCDFGLLVEYRDETSIFFRGRTDANIILVLRRGPLKMIGLGLVADSDDLSKLAAAQNCAVEIRKDLPGGEFVSLTDPSGLTIEVCSNLTRLLPIERNFSPSLWNSSLSKQRVDNTVRYDIQTHLVEKLGHSVIGVGKINDAIEWYQKTLGMIVTDFQFIADDPIPAVVFMRFDAAERPIDHHCIGIASVIETEHIHSAFEMDSLEQIAIGGEWLRNRAYQHSWGIGRHILGSQVFDYWREPKGDLFEHYSDGDVFTSTKAAGYHLLHSKAQHQWGPKQSNTVIG
jgi:catechol 2,3-dioxygenase-like lactoylglutathione lyase family enzyme